MTIVSIKTIIMIITTITIIKTILIVVILILIKIMKNKLKLFINCIFVMEEARFSKIFIVEIYAQNSGA